MGIVRVHDLPDVLHRIVERRRDRLEAEMDSIPDRIVELRRQRDSDNPIKKSLVEALVQEPETAIIAEVKMGSPRLGSLVDRVDSKAIATQYAANGAVGLSVVVEPDFFFGSYELLAQCQKASGLPTLAKDFVVDPIQIELASAAGASALLLIASLYTQEELRRLASQTRDLGLEPLIECHTVADVEKLHGATWELVGVNNRDLRTFQVDLDHSINLLPRLPASACKVAESGMSTAADCEYLSRAGFDAFLVGESLLLSDDPGAKLRQLQAANLA